MPDRVFNVLFLCTGNSARSIIAEAILNKIGAGRFRAYSAGSHPKGAVNPNTLGLLQEKGTRRGPALEIVERVRRRLRAAVRFHFYGLRDAAGEACPVWPGKPITAHWGIADPAAVRGTPARPPAPSTKLIAAHAPHRSFCRVAASSLDRLTLQAKLREIGRMDGATKARA